MNNWIRVKDRLPPRGTDILIYISSRNVIDIAWLDDGANGVDCFVGTEFGYDAKNVSHWQPLPEKPEVKDE
ncbi:DUF551 domain-containing protein [Rodentibacter haemolyticus]|uniref:DUF551 domain-containing protein n=1 Tax=Rodentibacter haemolyticus TaxID=2778911 RepID=A0ABX6UY13_9PAST|nr:DUF551 domain-containing protein [Rodentibacter haemolyticus]QPB42180.1 DUF551 domain-containing protein [Rodentibacter haemolyticus]